jgi:hypothetical protein
MKIFVKFGFFAEPCAVKSAKSQISKNPYDFLIDTSGELCKITDFANFLMCKNLRFS